MSKKYNYWVIYVLPKYLKDIKISMNSENDIVYAFTDDKCLLDNFISFHNMNKFKVKKYKLDREECNKLNQEHQSKYMHIYELSSSKSKKTIKVAMSIYEFDLLENTKHALLYRMITIWDKFTFTMQCRSLEIFKKNYRRCLEKLSFDKVISQNCIPNSNTYMDEFAIYCTLFSDILKKEGQE